MRSAHRKSVQIYKFHGALSRRNITNPRCRAEIAPDNQRGARVGRMNKHVMQSSSVRRSARVFDQIRGGHYGDGEAALKQRDELPDYGAFNS